MLIITNGTANPEKAPRPISVNDFGMFISESSEHPEKAPSPIFTRFSDKFYYFEVKDSSRLAINPDDFKHDKSLKGEFIRSVSADTDIDEETKEKIIACGINALMGEDLFEI